LAIKYVIFAFDLKFLIVLCNVYLDEHK